MLKKMSIVCASLFMLLVLGACSSNKLELDESLFKDGQTLMEQYEKGLNGEDVTPDDDVEQMFQALYDDEEFSSEEEELFVSDIVLLKTQYEAYLAQSGYESFSGDTSGDSVDTSDSTKEEAMEVIKEMKDKFGM